MVGRRTAYIFAILILTLCSIGAALAPNLATFVAMRILGGFEGTFFMVAGQTIIAETFASVRVHCRHWIYLH
jgi:MFS family permease